MIKSLLFVGFAVLLALVIGAPNVAAQGVNITGKWLFNVETQAGSGTPTVTIKQDGEKLTGHYSGQLGEADITGSIKGAAFSFKFTADLQGQSAAVTYTGTVEKDTVKGMLDIAGLGTGTFTGKKQ